MRPPAFTPASRSAIVSIHAPREGCDVTLAPTAGAGVAVSIHAPREGCDTKQLMMSCTVNLVSIHAPREGCDLSLTLIILLSVCFNSRTPGGVRHLIGAVGKSSLLFQFTHPGRGATHFGKYLLRVARGFNSRTPGGVRRRLTFRGVSIGSVSIHAPREGCDSCSR